VISDERELERFYRATVHDAYRYASRLAGRDRALAEDLVQDAYLALVRQVQTGDLTDASLGWLTTTIRHRFIDVARRTERAGRAIRRLRPVVARDSLPGPDPTSDLGLTSRERAAFVLRYVDDLPVAGVAAEMGISVRAAESLLARGLRRARKEKTNVRLD